jgi:hypothetical protein
MTTPPPPSRYDDEDETIPIGRLAAWGVLALVLLVGLYLYFRYQPGIVPLNQKPS